MEGMCMNISEQDDLAKRILEEERQIICRPEGPTSLWCLVRPVFAAGLPLSVKPIAKSG